MTKFLPGVTRKQAVAAMPWAYKVIKVTGGYMGFEFVPEYRMWLAQK